MFETQTLITYLAASVAIVLAPGPAQALVLARSISEGKKSGVMTGIGLNVGTVFHAVAAALGLSAVLATSAVAFTVVKYLGASYLIYLGVKAMLSKEESTARACVSTVAANGARPIQAFAKAVVTGILNPKVALFFLAFLPQFVDPTRGSVFMQFLVLGLILAALDVFYESLLAVIAGTLSGWLTNSPRIRLWQERATGVILVGLGVKLALTERN